MTKLVEMVYRGFPQQIYDVTEDLKPFYKFCGWSRMLQGQGGHSYKVESSGNGGHPCGSSGGEWNDQQGERLCVLAGDHAGHYKEKG